MWTMPRSTLSIIAVLLAACAVSGFVMGYMGTPSRARLPGESATGASSAPLAATDFRPLVEIAETPALPEPKAEAEEKAPVTPPELAELETPKPAAQTAPAAPQPKTAPAPGEDRVGDLLDRVAPPQETPIY